MMTALDKFDLKIKLKSEESSECKWNAAESKHPKRLIENHNFQDDLYFSVIHFSHLILKVRYSYSVKNIWSVSKFSIHKLK